MSPDARRPQAEGESETFRILVAAWLVFMALLMVALIGNARARMFFFGTQEPSMTEKIDERKEARKEMAGEHAAAESSSSVERSSAEARMQIGVYLTAKSTGTEKFLAGTIEELKKSGGTAFVFDVKGSNVFFHSAAPVANEKDLVLPMYELPDVLKIAHEQGLYTIGRFVAIKDHGFTNRVPETRIRDPRTGRIMSETWVDPSDPVAIEYNMQILCELAQSGIDEVNLDYIRFPTENPVAMHAVFDGKAKADRVETFIQAARETIDRCGPETKLGISTFAILGWNFPVNLETLGQDVVRFAPYVDVISPMAYPATFAEGAYWDPAKNGPSRMYYLVYRTMTGYRDLLGPEQSLKLRPWIQGYSVNVKDVTDEMKAVFDSGSCGFTVWNANNSYGMAFGAMKAMPKRPEHCQTK